jgi:hypothetical protein
LNAIERAGGPEKLESALKRLNNCQPVSKTELEVIQKIGGQNHANNVIDAVKAVKKKRRKPVGRKPVGRKPVGRKPVGRKPVAVSKKRVIKTAKSCPICPMVRAKVLINRLSKDNIKNILVKVLKSRG